MANLANKLPADFLTRLKLLVSAEKFSEIIESIARPRPTTVRANRLKTTPRELVGNLQAENINLGSTEWYAEAFVLQNQPKAALFSTQPYRRGEVYIQSLSSMIPPLVINPQPGERILDLTAAPGSKTTQMAAMMENTGEIVANDWHPIRLLKLKANLSILGVTNVKVIKMHGEELWKRFPEQFDRTLVDVPCSMEGRINVDKPKTYEQWSVKKIRELAKRQQWLLRSAVSATKPGGVIVYSTCTLAPEENEGVIDWLLKKEVGKIEIEDISIPGLEVEPGITQWGNKKYASKLSKAIRIYPSRLMEGFFVAKIRKIRSTVI